MMGNIWHRFQQSQPASNFQNDSTANQAAPIFRQAPWLSNISLPLLLMLSAGLYVKRATSQELIDLSDENIEKIDDITGDAAKFDKLLEVAMLKLEAGADDDDTKNDVNIIYTGASSDETVMVLEDFLDGNSLQDLTLADFDII